VLSGPVEEAAVPEAEPVAITPKVIASTEETLA